MTTTTPIPQHVTLDVEPGTRLADLVDRYTSLKAIADEANERFEAAKTAIKAEMNAAAPSATRVDLTGVDTPLTLRWVPRRDLDVKRFKAELPEMYEQYRKPPGAGRWELRSS